MISSIKPSFVLLALILILLALIAAARVDAQVAACPPNEGTLDGLSARVECLESALAAAEASQQMLERALLNLAIDLQALGDELRPSKEMQQFDAVHAAWVRWGVYTFSCTDDLQIPNNFVLVGGQLSDEEQTFRDPGTLGCTVPHPVGVPRGYCNDSSVCKFRSRSAGCFVNATWWYWYRARPGVSLAVEDVCR